MSFVEIIKYGSDLSVAKLFSMVDQSLLDCPVSCQDHHLLKSKVDCEHRSILFGQLKRWRQVRVRFIVLEKKCNLLTYTENTSTYARNRTAKIEMNYLLSKQWKQTTHFSHQKESCRAS